ncbi:MAG: hypothetical protein OXU74_06710 [Gemmatimonadota bacterium]|nr:hypothetical protein [Gemmatimonadota bacterium]
MAERLLALRRRLQRETRSVTDMEEQALTLMELELAMIPSIDHAAAQVALELCVSPAKWDTLVLASELDPMSWKICRELVRLLRGFAPTLLAASPLWDWALDVAQGTRVEPRKWGRPKNLPAHDLAIAACVLNLRDIGHRSATDPNIPKGTAFDLVAKRLYRSPGAVRAIWRRHRTMLETHHGGETP